MRRTLLALSLLLSTNAFAAPLWEDISQQSQNKLSRSSLPSYTARILSLDEPTLRQQLLSPIVASTTSSKNSLAKASANKLLELPLPDGSMVQLTVEEYPLLSKALAAKFPNVKAWRVHEANGKNIHGRIDLTATGFHAMLTLEDGDTIFIDPNKTTTNNRLYDSFSKKKNKHLFQHNETENEVLIKSPATQKRSLEPQKKQAAPSKDLITYRLALAATGEYVALKGGTKEAAFSAMVTTINRVNEIYERDLSIRLSLIANTDTIIYTDAKTDPFTNGDAYTMLDETIANMDAVIGDANYDIGHLFGGAGTGGLALLSGICRANQVSHKAGGITGSASPHGDSFDIDYVAHEMGHQFGATHTFNSLTQNCGGNNREADTAVEPGSGSTIMSYAGICGTNNLQNNSDAMFNAVSIAQINNYTRNNEGSSCGARSSSNNTNPTIATTQNFNIPSNTPFILNSDANDTDGDALSYSWDQIDANGTAVDVDFDAGDSPIFRSYLPSSVSYRYFPHVDTLFGSLPVKGEMLALTNRELNFATTVRDNRGGVTREDTKITTSGNPFTLNSQNTSHLYSVSENIDVNWNVAGTNVAPVSCQNIDIKLLASDGTTQNLLLNTPNDGSQNLTIPTYISTVSHARIMVACSNNVFFAVSKGNIAVNGINPIVTISSPSVIEGDTESKILNYEVKLTTAISEDATINYTIRDNQNNTQVQNGLVRIIAGQTTANIAQIVAGNLSIDGDKYYDLTLFSPINVQFDTTNQINSLKAVGTVIDNDNNNIDVTISNMSMIENGTGKMVFTINLSHASDTHTTINYATVNGTAKAGSDFTFDNGILFIPAGRTSETITITILNDQLVEDNETFQLLLTKPSSNITLLHDRATATIIDDDKKVEVPADKQDTPTASTTDKKAGGSMGSIFIFLMLYISLLRLKIQARRSI